MVISIELYFIIMSLMLFGYECSDDIVKHIFFVKYINIKQFA